MSRTAVSLPHLVQILCDGERDEAFGQRAIPLPVGLVGPADPGEVDRERRIPVRQAVGVADPREERREITVGGCHGHDPGQPHFRRTCLQPSSRSPDIEFDGDAIPRCGAQLFGRPLVQRDRGSAAHRLPLLEERVAAHARDERIRDRAIGRANRVHDVGKHRGGGHARACRNVRRHARSHVVQKAALGFDSELRRRDGAHPHAEVVERGVRTKRCFRCAAIPSQQYRIHAAGQVELALQLRHADDERAHLALLWT